MTILSVIFGVFGSVYFGLFPAVLVDFVGLEMLSGAMAINMLMQGLGLSISNPILGNVDLPYLVYTRLNSPRFFSSFNFKNCKLFWPVLNSPKHSCVLFKQ